MTWKDELRQSIRTLEELSKVIPLTAEEQTELSATLEDFPMAVPPYYLSLIDVNDPNDPIKKLAIPSLAERDKTSGSFDTSGEGDNTVAPGLQHKYKETALLLSTQECAMYCRHCFRKRMVGLQCDDPAKDIKEVEKYVKAHPEITNVLVSGGDALMNSNERVHAILAMLCDIPHLDLIRIATRIPVSLPSRITGDNELQAILKKYGAKKQLFMVTQFDHPREITPEAQAAVKTVLELGIPMRNQTVLLKGVNDDPQVLATLLRQLTSIGAEPYYVFQCRPVTGVKNQFQLPLKEGYRIVEAAKAMQNGLGKSFRFGMSHKTGKLEILGMLDEGTMVFKYHEAKNPDDIGRIFTKQISDDQTWLDEDY